MDDNQPPKKYRSLQVCRIPARAEKAKRPVSKRPSPVCRLSSRAGCGLLRRHERGVVGGQPAEERYRSRHLFLSDVVDRVGASLSRGHTHTHTHEGQGARDKQTKGRRGEGRGGVGIASTEPPFETDRRSQAPPSLGCSFTSWSTP